MTLNAVNRAGARFRQRDDSSRESVHANNSELRWTRGRRLKIESHLRLDKLVFKFRQKAGVSMGGQGSGGHNSKRTRRDVQCARLDVHELSREGKLRLGTRGILFGTIWFEITGGPNAQHLVLKFPCRSASGEQLNPITQDILCYWRKAHYGGRYLMFSCSECYRSARVLYAWYFSDRIWFLGAANALASPISPQWATGGAAHMTFCGANLCF